MKILVGSVAAIGCLGFLALAAAQDQPLPAENDPPAAPYQGGSQNPQPNGPAVQPDQPVVSQDPRLQPRQPSYPEAQNAVDQDPRRQAVGQGVPAAPRPRVPPFMLSAHEEVQLARVLTAWEQQSSKVDRFHCTFYKFEYNRCFSPSTPITDKGEIYYAAPDKGVFRVEPPQRQSAPREANTPSREQKWICDGKAVYEYDFDKQQIRKYSIPPEQQGEGIREGPLPFIFGAKAARLQARYWIRINTPADAKGQIWLEVYPKYQQDATNFCHIDLILSSENLQPFALQIIHDSRQQSRTVYQFQQININGNRMSWMFNDPFHVDVPRGWQIVSGDVPRVQGAPPANARPSVLGSRAPIYEPRRE